MAKKCIPDRPYEEVAELLYESWREYRRTTFDEKHHPPWEILERTIEGQKYVNECHYRATYIIRHGLHLFIEWFKVTTKLGSDI